MPKTLLAIDDSATMRKVIEITFVGEDFNVLTAGDRGGLLAKLTENPAAVVIDTTLEGDDGYAICKEVRQRLPRAAVVLLASRYTPYDASRGRDAGADDYIDKPFDTQQLIDKVKKAIGVREATGPAAEAPSRAEAPYRQPAPAIAQAPSPPAPAVAARDVSNATTAARPAYQPGPAPARAATLMFSPDGPAAGAPAPGAAPSPPMHKPVAPPMAARPAAPVAAPTPAPVHAPAPAPAASAIAAQTNGQLAPKLAQMGLTPAQVEGVLALSREVIEQVVWEVVPQLAETIIKEELARLTKE